MRITRHARTLATGLLLATALSAPTHAAVVVEAGVEFRETALILDSSSPQELELCATALYRYRRIIKGYAAALYRSDCDARRELRLDQPQRLELSYFWSIEGRRFGEAAEKILRDALDEQQLATLEPRLRDMNRHYESVEPGDRYALTYLPGRGTELSKNGRPLVTIAGEDFARAYFGIWLGEKPMDRRLRNALLGGRAR